MIDRKIIRKELTEHFSSIYNSIIVHEGLYDLLLSSWDEIPNLDLTDNVIEFLNGDFEKKLPLFPLVNTIDCEVYRSDQSIFKKTLSDWYVDLLNHGISFKLNSLNLLLKNGSNVTSDISTIIVKTEKGGICYAVALLDIIKRHKPIIGINLCFSTDNRFPFDYPLQILDKKTKY